MKWLIKDNITGMYLVNYSTDLSLCSWGNPTDAIEFDTKQQTIDTISAWGGDTRRFIGTNPPPR